jgi:hypothetical protein
MIAESSPATLEFHMGTGQQNKIAKIWGKRKWLRQLQHSKKMTVGKYPMASGRCRCLF